MKGGRQNTGNVVYGVRFGRRRRATTRPFVHVSEALGVVLEGLETEEGHRHDRSPCVVFGVKVDQ